VHDIESGLAASLSIAKKGLLLRLMRLIECLAFNCASELIVLTDGMAAEIRDIGYRRPITVLPIWSSLFPEKARSAAAAPVISYSGNFGKKQNLDQLLPLIRMLDERRPEVKVILRGDGSERERIEALVKGMGVRNTSFLPLIAADKLCEWLQSVDLHLIPQAMNVANYALPSKLFTIMAAGGPFVCVAEQDSPLDHLTRDSGAGMCVRTNDDEALFSAVIQLLDNREMLAEIGQRGRSFVRANMDRDKILKSYEERLVGSQHGQVARQEPSLSTV
jgi:colanic acid biosynthesis glycosyl transferase WcaI